jgi:hypothetical protein
LIKFCETSKNNVKIGTKRANLANWSEFSSFIFNWETTEKKFEINSAIDSFESRHSASELSSFEQQINWIE